MKRNIQILNLLKNNGILKEENPVILFNKTNKFYQDALVDVLILKEKDDLIFYYYEIEKIDGKLTDECVELVEKFSNFSHMKSFAINNELYAENAINAAEKKSLKLNFDNLNNSLEEKSVKNKKVKI